MVMWAGSKTSLQMWHFGSKGCRSNGVGLRLVLWQLFRSLLGKWLFSLLCLFNLFCLSSSWPIHFMLCRREELVTGRPFLEGRILGLSWVVMPNRIKREGPLKKGQNKAWVQSSSSWRKDTFWSSCCWFSCQTWKFGQAWSRVSRGTHHFFEEEQKQVRRRKDKCG